MTGLEARVEVTREGGFRLDVQFSIEPGRTAALLGPNGAGKSTAVAALAGLLALDGGRISLGGRVLDDPVDDVFVAAEDRRIGVVFQEYLLFDHMSVLENIAFGALSRGMSRHQRQSVAGEWAERLGLEGLGSKRPRDLSGGQAQRVALARALVTEPEMLLLDEPLSALDVTTRVELRRVLADHLSRFDGPRLLITHDPTEAFLLADRVFVIESGAITQVGSPDEIRLRPRTPYAADLAGSNLVRGEASKGIVQVGGHRVHIAEHEIDGPVLLSIHPHSISVHRARPEGSQRNAWPTTVERVEALGERVRLLSGPPLPLTVEVTRDSIDSLGLRPGVEVWIALKATEIGVERE